MDIKKLKIFYQIGFTPPPPQKKLFERCIGNIGPEISFLVNPPPSPTLSICSRR